MRRGFAASSADSVSRHSTRPLVGSLRPAMMRNAVDLPQPDGPSSETNSPSRTSRLSRASATTPLANVLPTPSSATTEALDGGGGAGQGADTLRNGLGGRSGVILHEMRRSAGTKQSFWPTSRREPRTVRRAGGTLSLAVVLR